MPKKKTFDPIILMSAIALTGIGIVMVYSASAVVAMEKFGDPQFFLKRHIMWVMLGLVSMIAIMRVDYRELRRFTYPLLVVSIILLIMVLIPYFSKTVGGARRWLSLGPLSLQPAEIVKLALVLFLAHSLIKRQELLKDFAYGYLPNLVVLAVFFILIIIQPDLGSVLVISIVAFILMFVAGIKFSFLFTTFLMMLPFLYMAVFRVGYRKKRIMAFLDPWNDPLDTGFQTIQSFLALGRGGFFGLGLGEGKQKLFYLPEPHTDFVFSVMGEELGFIGVSAVMIIFLILIWRGIRVSLRSPDLYGTYLALGIILTIGIQVVINMGIATGLLPTKGLPLPFLSVGGSSLLVSMVSIGVLLNISEHTA
ncbi:MAG: putative lipid II flippase FtsW [Nitrospinae bacterium]|nr:putative lipid II flippase FtsW [Nitrospinota bacterium]MBI3815228.1 putative lipid II flippase FtsW [Nitrospinota bacterium]